MRNFFSLILLSLLFVRCSGDNATEQPEVKKAERSVFQQDFHKKWKGTIGKYKVTIELSKTDTLLSGTYYYNEVGMPISLSGAMDSAGNFSLTEKNENFDIIGTFTGKLTTNHQLRGYWQNPKNKKRLDFLFEETEQPFVTVGYEDFNAENCIQADQNRSKSVEEMNYWDTLCTSLSIHLMKVSAENEDVADRINKIIEEEITSGSEDYVELKVQSAEEFARIVKNKPLEFGFELELFCNLVATHEGILCISLGEYSYGFGAAHPNHGSQYYNFDLSSGKLIHLKDLLLPSFKQKLNRIAEKNFIKANGDEGWDFEKGKFELNEDFTITTKGLLFSFDPYEIGSYAAGSPEVFITYKEMREFINPDGLLKQFIK